jgi:NAD(P)-dependent dehydrogenase (short-subunit alcohol dehydrogenase family)
MSRLISKNSEATMLLADKVAVIYGAGGSVGGAIARAYAKEGATVVLAGRTLASLDAVAEAIRREGGEAECATVDATDRESVDRHAAEIASRHGRIDLSFNGIGLGDTHGTKLAEIDDAKFLTPLEIAMRSHLFVGAAMARHMRSGGVLMSIIANAGLQPRADVGVFGVACAAIAALYRQFACELGPQGIRALCLLSAGSPDSAGVSHAIDLLAKNEGVTREVFERKMGEDTLLKHLPSLAEVADAAVLMASDRARGMTATMFNVTCGQIAN